MTIACKPPASPGQGGWMPLALDLGPPQRAQRSCPGGWSPHSPEAQQPELRQVPWSPGLGKRLPTPTFLLG